MNSSTLVFDLDDKSVVVDELCRLTGKTRNYWTLVPIWKLRMLYRRALLIKQNSRIKRTEKNGMGGI